MAKMQPQMVEEGEAIFLEAMRRVYANDTARMEWPGTPGAKPIEFKKGPWRVVDTWISGNGDHGAGWTTQYVHGTPFWQMHRQGRCPKSLIPFLKRALLSYYQLGIFHAGRGPKSFFEKNGETETFSYTNKPTKTKWKGPGAFSNFVSMERAERIVHDKYGRYPAVVENGYYEIRGMRLIYV